MGVAPHNPLGPVANAAALHFDLSTPNFLIQEDMLDGCALALGRGEARRSKPNTAVGCRRKLLALALRSTKPPQPSIRFSRK